MELIRGIHNLRPRHRGCVLTIGNFDGVHLGHQRILQRVHEQAEALAVRSAVMLFEPQPREFFAPDQAPARLMSLRDKVCALREQGVDQVLCARFNQRFRSQTAEQFVSDLLLDGLAIRHLVVGDDFRFGADRQGDFAYLRRAGDEHGFAVEDTPTCQLDGKRVSSTRIREALAAGNLALAQRLLGRPYSVSGRVRHGDAIGRTLNLPTANLALARQQSPLSGVYVVRVHGASEQALPAVANIGYRPTVGGQQARIEVHLLDFSGDLYGRHLRVDFLHHLRGEKKFDGLDALKAAIHQDIDQAKAWLAKQDSQA